jgi:hypothetical protein
MVSDSTEGFAGALAGDDAGAGAVEAVVIGALGLDDPEQADSSSSAAGTIM